MSKTHYGFISSTIFSGADEKGIITTTTSPQVFEIAEIIGNEQYVINVLEITADNNPVKIQYNDGFGYEYIEPNGQTYQDGFDIYKITCLSPIGTKFKFKGQTKEIKLT